MKLLKAVTFWPSMLKIRLGANIPLRVYHIMTGRCNLKCPYCLVDDIKKYAIDELSTPKTIKILNEFKVLGTKVWIFGGGEPTIRDDLPELVDAAKGLGMMAGISSNGYRINSMLPTFKKVDYLQLSIDGPKEHHDSIRGKGSFDILVKSMEGLRSINKHFVMNCVISEKNIQYTDFVCDLANEFNADIELSPEISFKTDLVDKDINNVDMNKIYEIIVNKKKTNRNLITLLPYIERLRDLQNGKIERFTPICLAGKSYCALSADGIVHICFNKMTGKLNESMRNVSVKEQFDKLKLPNCDCSYRCLYILNYMRTVPIKQSMAYMLKMFMTGNFRDVVDFLRAVNQ